MIAPHEVRLLIVLLSDVEIFLFFPRFTGLRRNPSSSIIERTMATTTFRPKYIPTRTDTHWIVGKYDHYVLPRAPRSNGYGAQAQFITNNARPNMKREYGIKLFLSISEAYAAYQRQKLAADRGCAPPVRRMVCVEYPARRNSSMIIRRWGYQTCIAYGVGKLAVPTIAESCGDVWMISETGLRDMCKTLWKISTANTQKDHGMIGVFRRRSVPMNRDLHHDNIGFWRKRPVCIDFGYHIIGEHA